LGIIFARTSFISKFSGKISVLIFGYSVIILSVYIDYSAPEVSFLRRFHQILI
jgi:hypothetical protein